MLVTLEGCEGNGKTTQAALLAKWLESTNTPHLLTKEPGAILSKECQQIRKLLLDPSNTLDERAELFLYLADRAQHYNHCIRPALESGKLVISDRYSFSTIAYQGFGRGHRGLGSKNWFFETLGVASGFRLPDVSFILDMPIELGLARARSSNCEFAGGDRIEREELDFHRKIREGFLWVAQKYPNVCVVLNAEQTIEELHEEIKSILSARIVK